MKIHDTSTPPNAAWRNDVLTVFLILVVVLPYSWVCIQNGFVWDDDQTIVHNEYIAKLSNIRLLFSNEYFDAFFEDSYRPVVTLSYFIESTLCGKKPGGYHATSFILHFGVVCLIFAIGRSVGLGARASSVPALLFAVLPVNVEAVNGISLREDLLATLFTLASFLMYARARGKTSAFGGQIIPALLLLLALFSKESALVMLVMVAVYEFSFRLKGDSGYRTSLLRLAPFTIITAFYCVVRFGVMDRAASATHGARLLSHHGGSMYASAISFPGTFLYYLSRIFVPSHLSIIYDFPPETGLFTLSAMSAAIALGAIFALIALIWRQNRQAAYWMLWFLVFLGPVSNLWPLWNPVALRYLYLPTAGLCLAMGLGLLNRTQTWTARRTLLSYTLIGIVLAMNLLCSIRYSANWQNGQKLWSYHTQIYPYNAKVRRNLGFGYEKSGTRPPLSLALLDKAEHQYETALAIDPSYSRVHNNLAYLYTKLGQTEKAAEQYELCVRRTEAFDVDSFNNLGVAYLDLGVPELAEGIFKKLIEVSPQYVNAHVNLAKAYSHRGRLRDAAIAAQTALDLDRYCIPALLIFAEAMQGFGHLEDAENNLRYALEIAPRSSTIALALGRVLNQQSKYREALAILRPAVARKPGLANLRLELGITYANLKQNDKALEELDRAVEKDPKNLDARMHKGQLLLDMAQYESALREFQASLELNPQIYEAHFAIAKCYEAMNQTSQAIEAYQASLQFARDEETAENVQREIERLLDSPQR